MPGGPPPSPSAVPASGRPREHDGSTNTEGVILAATERLLADTPVQDLSVATIIREAGVSRATFYFYFSSKFAVIARLLESVMNAVYATVTPLVSPGDDDAASAIRRSFEDGIPVWVEHRTLLRAASEQWPAVPELRAIWVGAMARFAEAIGDDIERRRSAGEAPPGPPARQLAAVLVWSSERVLHVAGTDAHPELEDEPAVLDALVRLWAGTIYGIVETRDPAGRP